MRRNGKADGRYTVKAPGREPHATVNEGAALALALDWAAKLPEPGSVVVRDMDEVVAVARGDGAGRSAIARGAV